MSPCPSCQQSFSTFRDLIQHLRSACRAALAYTIACAYPPPPGEGRPPDVLDHFNQPIDAGEMVARIETWRATRNEGQGEEGQS